MTERHARRIIGAAMTTRDAARGTTARWRREAALAVACGACGALAYAVDGAAGRPLAVLACAVGGWDAAREAWKSLRGGRADIHLLMLLAARPLAAAGAADRIRRD